MCWISHGKGLGPYYVFVKKKHKLSSLYLGRRQKSGSFGWWGRCGFGARPQLSVKNYHFLFLLPFDAEAFKTCKNTI